MRTVVQVAVSDVDYRGWLDYSNAMVVCAQVVDMASGCKKYRLASKAGVLLNLYRPGYLRALQYATPLLLHGLDGVV
ncbi:MAG: hypothetical protein SGPRY_000139 [Prymnesium sp.]